MFSRPMRGVPSEAGNEPKTPSSNVPIRGALGVVKIRLELEASGKGTGLGVVSGASCKPKPTHCPSVGMPSKKLGEMGLGNGFGALSPMGIAERCSAGPGTSRVNGPGLLCTHSGGGPSKPERLGKRTEGNWPLLVTGRVPPLELPSLELQSEPKLRRRELARSGAASGKTSAMCGKLMQRSTGEMEEKRAEVGV